MKAIELDHVGPIERLTIPVPADGGVVVLHGSSGVGKTHAIQAVRALHDQSARKNLRASDGVPSGKIDGLGVTVRLGRSNTVRGELECESLESGIDPSLLVDPGIKDPDAADSKRLATLVRLSGVKIDAGKWFESVGEYGGEIALKDLVSDDPVVTADKIRRRLHDAALTKERLAQSKGAEGAALRKSVADIDTAVEIDGVAAMESATARLSELKAKQALYVDSKSRIELAKAELAKWDDIHEDLEDAHIEAAKWDKQLAAAIDKRNAVNDQIASLRARLDELEDESAACFTQEEIAKARLDAAVQRQSDLEHQQFELEKLKKLVAQSLPEEITDSQIEQAEKERLSAIELVKQSEVIARAKKTANEAAALTDESNRLAAIAESMRRIARSTDSVLEQALIDAGFDSIKVHDGRLCVESDRGLEPVSELSTGERWRLALDIAARSLPKGALLSVHQEGWQALDHDLRREVAVMVKERGLVIVTAEVDDGDIRAEVL
jgi:hypothetical protein